MDQEPLISVVIPCFNHGRFLGQAIESVLDQTPGNFEIVIVDDGSTDDSAAVARRYSQCRYIPQMNQGVSAARNTGIRHTQGQYVTFLDADDIFFPGALAAGLACFEKNPACGLVYGRYRKIDAAGAESSPVSSRNGASDYYLALLQGNIIGMHATVLYRRAAIDKVGPFQSGLNHAEDYDLYLRVAREFPVAEHDALVAAYRSHDNNASLNYPLMRRHALAVLGAQSPYAQSNPQYRAAIAKGLSNWREYYGYKMLCDFRSAAVAHGLRLATWKKAARVLAYRPSYFRTVASQALHSLRKPAIGAASGS